MMVFLMKKNTILSVSLLLSIALGFSMLVKVDFNGTPSAFAQTITPKMHLDEGIKALKNGDNQGAMMHLNGVIKAFRLPLRVNLQKCTWMPGFKR